MQRTQWKPRGKSGLQTYGYTIRPVLLINHVSESIYKMNTRNIKHVNIKDKNLLSYCILPAN